MTTVTVLAILAALGLGGYIWWTEHQTDLAVSALRRSGAVVTSTGYELKVSATDNRLTNEELEHLADLGRPFHLNLTMSPYLTDAGISHLAGITQMKSLALGNVDLTDEGLSHLSGLTGLVRLDLSKTRITDDGLKHLADMQELEELTLNYTNVSNDGLMHLKDLDNLKYLVVGATRITAEGEEELKKELPELLIFR